MPQAIPLIAGYVVSGAALAGTYLTGAALAFAQFAIGGVVAYGTSKVLGLDEQPGLPEPGVQANVKGTVQPIPIVYGRRRVGGVLAQICTTGKVATRVNLPTGTYDIPDTIDNKYINLVCCWAEGEIEGVQLLYFDDDLSTSEDFEGFFTVEHFTGTDDQEASPAFLAALDNTWDEETALRFWSTDHRLRGIAYTYCRFEYDANAWPTGIPAVTADIKGRKVLDLRTDTWAWSDNPALCIYDYLTNTRFGRGIDASEIDAQSFIDAANYCDQQIFIETQAAVPPDIPRAGVTQARYTCDAILNPDDTHLDNLRLLLGTCRGALVFSGGLYKLKLDKVEVPTFDLTEDNIVGGWSILLESTESRYNRVHAQWINRSQRYQDDFAIVSSDTFLAADNNQVLEARIDLPATTNRFRALQIAGMVLRQSRYSLRCEVRCTIEGLQCEVFDVIRVTHETPGWTDQLFRVMGISLENDDEVRLQLQQYADDVYDLDSQNDEDSPPPTGLPDPRQVKAPLFLEAVGRVSRLIDGRFRTRMVAIWYIQEPEPANVLYYEFRYLPRDEEGRPWTTAQIPVGTPFILPSWVSTTDGFRPYTHEFDAEPGITYDMEVRAVNTLGVRSEAATNSLEYGQVTGAGSTPGVPTNVYTTGLPGGARIRWTPGADTAFTQIWVTKSTDTTSGRQLVGATSATSFDVPAPSTAAGTPVVVTFWLRGVNDYGEFGEFEPPGALLGYTQDNTPPTFASEAAAIAYGLVSGDPWLDSSDGNTLKVVA